VRPSLGSSVFAVVLDALFFELVVLLAGFLEVAFDLALGFDLGVAFGLVDLVARVARFLANLPSVAMN